MLGAQLRVRGSSSISPEPGVSLPAPHHGSEHGKQQVHEQKAKECSCPKTKQKPPKATGQRCGHRGWERCGAAHFWKGRAAADGVMGTKLRVTAACPGEETCSLSARERFEAPGSLLRARAEEISLVQKHRRSFTSWECIMGAILVVFPVKTHSQSTRLPPGPS